MVGIPRSLQLLTHITLVMACFAVAPIGSNTNIWTVLAIDLNEDGLDGSADIAQLSYRHDRQQDMLWFRVTMYGQPNADALGVTLAFDTAAEGTAKMPWWGANKAFSFDRLLTVWATRRDGRYEGTIGVGDSAGAKEKKFNNVLQNNLQIRVEGDSILIGAKRTDVTDKLKMTVMAAVGSDQQIGDELMRPATLDLSALLPTRGLRELDLGRNNFRLAPGDAPLAENQAPRIKKRGHGRGILILIPGIYSGDEVFDGFMARNESRYTFHVVTPPGLSGTRARALPPETISYGELTWTRRLARDVLDLINRERLQAPVIVTHGFPGSLVAHELAARHPEKIAGVIDVAAMPLQFSPSPRDPSGKTLATPAERVAIVNKGWAEKWFKYVTPETWESNNYQKEMFANDLDRAEQVRQQVEAVPLPVKIRYLIEYMASDQTSELDALTVPLLALRPGFDDTLLANPAFSWYKASFQDAWNAPARNPRIQLVTIPGARALMLDDQPALTDDAIGRFLHTLAASIPSKH
jgi:pimeloyl-ACP methyl ester carboxylesterase